MSQKPQNPPAFPRAALDAWGKSAPLHDGMSLRDYFAIQLAATMADTVMRAAREEGQSAKVGAQILARTAYRIADVMLDERTKEPEA